MKEQSFTEDPRYRIAAKEAWMTIFLFLLNFAWWFAFAYGLGAQSPQTYSYILGFPAWFFWSVIVGSIVFCALAFVMVRFFYTEMPLGADPYESSCEERK